MYLRRQKQLFTWEWEVSLLCCPVLIDWKWDFSKESLYLLIFWDAEESHSFCKLRAELLISRAWCGSFSHDRMIRYIWKLQRNFTISWKMTNEIDFLCISTGRYSGIIIYCCCSWASWCKKKWEVCYATRVFLKSMWGSQDSSCKALSLKYA